MCLIDRTSFYDPVLLYQSQVIRGSASLVLCILKSCPGYSQWYKYWLLPAFSRNVPNIMWKLFGTWEVGVSVVQVTG